VAAAASSGGGGGGAWSPLAGLGLLLVAGLLPRRRTRGR
jgi:MYXO-CTERM domain-containing protein